MDNEFTKSYYKISEAAEMLGISPVVLRQWESTFPGLNPRRSAGNQRYYTPRDLRKLQLIKYLRYDKGLNTEAVKEQLKRNSSNVSKKLEVIDKLKKVREDLEMLQHCLNLRAQKI